MSTFGARKPIGLGHGQARVIEGRALAARLIQHVQHQVRALARVHSVTPGLAVIQVGTDPASRVYVRNKRRRTLEAGMSSFDYDLPGDTSQSRLLELIDEVNGDSGVNGILVQLPLPPQMDSAVIEKAVDPTKDVDGFHEVNVGRLWSGAQGLVPCTPLGCMALLRHVVGDLSGLHAVVVGCSNIVGKPLAGLLLAAHCTVTMAHEYTRDLPAISRSADILVVAVGHAEMVHSDWIKPGATVIDVGINRIVDSQGRTRLVGDVAFDEACGVAGAITPVPGGVGPMTIAYLLHNTVVATCRQHGLAVPDVQE